MNRSLQIQHTKCWEYCQHLDRWLAMQEWENCFLATKQKAKIINFCHKIQRRIWNISNWKMVGKETIIANFKMWKIFLEVNLALHFILFISYYYCLTSLTISQSVQSFSRVQLFATPWTTARQASLSITNSRSLPKPMSIESVMPSNHLILCWPLLLWPSMFPSIRVFSNESTLHVRWPKYWSFSFSISPSKEIPGLISFRMDWLDVLAVQGTLRSLLQHRSSKASVLRCSAYFTVQLSHPYMTTGKTIALTRQTFVGKVMSLLFNMLSRLVITFLPRSKHLLISWLQSPSAVILEPKKIKSATVSTVSPSISQGWDQMPWF